MIFFFIFIKLYNLSFLKKKKNNVYFFKIEVYDYVSGIEQKNKGGFVL